MENSVYVNAIKIFEAPSAVTLERMMNEWLCIDMARITSIHYIGTNQRGEHCAYIIYLVLKGDIT